MAFLIILGAALLLPLAYAIGGHNGVTLIGALAVIFAITLVVATHTDKDSS